MPHAGPLAGVEQLGVDVCQLGTGAGVVPDLVRFGVVAVVPKKRSKFSWESTDEEKVSLWKILRRYLTLWHLIEDKN